MNWMYKIIFSMLYDRNKFKYYLINFEPILFFWGHWLFGCNYKN